MLQAWLAKPFQNLNQGSLWPSQRKWTCSFLADLTASCQVLPKRLPASQSHSSQQFFPSPPDSSFQSNLWSCHSLDQNLSVPSCCLLASTEMAWDAGLGPVCSHPYFLNGSWAFFPLCPSFWIALLREYVSTPPCSWPPPLPPTLLSSLPTLSPVVKLPALPIKCFQVLLVGSFDWSTPLFTSQLVFNTLFFVFFSPQNHSSQQSGLVSYSSPCCPAVKLLNIYWAEILLDHDTLG